MLKPLHFHLLNVFTDSSNLGNQCCVLIVEDLSNEKALQQIAKDFNLPATTFLVPKENASFDVRWFAPEGEIDLCGHGSVAAMWVMHRSEGWSRIQLNYKTGQLNCEMKQGFAWIEGDRIESDEAEIPAHVQDGFNGKVVGYFPSSNKHIVLLHSEEEVRNMKPNWMALQSSNTFSYAITAKGESVDFVSRTILPHLRILEDHATGSSHMALAPFWASRIGQHSFEARQLSERGGFMRCEVTEKLVRVGGQCKVFAEGRMLEEPLNH